MTANKPMTGKQLDELMTIAVNMQRDSEKVSDRPAALFAYAVQVAVLELRKVRNEAAALAAENAGIKAAIDATIRWQQSTDPENVESVRMLVDVKTPATEVILADVMAQGWRCSPKRCMQISAVMMPASSPPKFAKERSHEQPYRQKRNHRFTNQ